MKATAIEKIAAAGFALLFLASGCAALSSNARPFRFVILGDRTGEAQPGVFEQIWQETTALHPSFALSIGDSIQGLNDVTAQQEWESWRKIVTVNPPLSLWIAPGNHDIWSTRSEQLFRQYAGHAPHYSFDYEQVHVTVLDNSRTENFSSAELAFLRSDLAAHAKQPVKFIVSHRPSWLLHVVFSNPDFPIQQLAKQYGVRYVIAGHVHQLLHQDLDGVMYLSVQSAGGHLRASKKYEDGWFFGYTIVDVDGTDVRFAIKETGNPYGKGRETSPADWGVAGLVHRR